MTHYNSNEAHTFVNKQGKLISHAGPPFSLCYLSLTHKSNNKIFDNIIVNGINENSSE
jgi:hypothetical protein